MKRSESDISPFIEKVRPIIEAVSAEGDKALSRFARELDKADVPPDGILVSEAEFDAAFKAVDAGRERGDRVRHRQHPQLPRGAEARADVAQGNAARRLCRRPLARRSRRSASMCRAARARSLR